MKKSLLALAALTAFAGAASAQSSVTLYGRVDLSLGEAVGGDRQYIANGSGSRLGLRGVEDLGGGMKAIFNIEHRFAADTGTAQNMNVGGRNPNGTSNAATPSNNRFWNARSLVGLQGGWGEISLGREYTTAFLQNQLLADPWGYDTVVAGSYGTIQTSGNTNVAGLGGIGRVRNDSAITWKFAAGGFQLQAQYAEGTDAIDNFDSNPYNVAVNYAAGPLLLSYAYERTGFKGTTAGGADEYIQSILGAWNFGAFRISGYWAEGEHFSGDDREGFLFGFTMPIGQAELRLSYGYADSKSAITGAKTKIAPIGLGYHYALSKRTTIYADYIYESEFDPVVGQKYGYDFGIKHNF